MTKIALLAVLAALALPFPAAVSAAEAARPAPSPGEIVAAAPAAEWRAIAPADLLVMDLAPLPGGKARRVVIQLMPPPFSQGWVSNMRLLASAHWWDGTSVYRVQDNYVTQWGDADGEDKAKAKPLPAGLAVVPESDYATGYADLSQIPIMVPLPSNSQGGTTAVVPTGPRVKVRGLNFKLGYDSYASFVGHTYSGWPVAYNGATVWPIHCYGMVGVARDLSPDTGTGAELYTVIGHAPRALDRNIALIGRVIEGMQWLSSLPRGTGGLGVYETPEERTRIVSVRLASELPAAEQPRFEYLSTEGDTFARYAEAIANRRDPFFIQPAGGADICTVRVPVRRVKS